MSPLSLAASLTVLIYCTMLPQQTESKTFGECELATYLAGKSVINRSEIPTWVCIASKESTRNSNKKSPKNKNGSKDHGIFQINDKYWCTDSGPAGLDCNAKCSSFEDDDIADDVTCVAKIYKQTKRSKGDGFKAWSTYKFCDSPDKVNAFVKGCSY
uniref:lysozyme n=1 Tax=Cacopsylla melanoneura TaxID=428564 RepID=A0A8D8W6W8_9HEMI